MWFDVSLMWFVGFVSFVCGFERFGVVWCGVVWCGVVWCVAFVTFVAFVAFVACVVVVVWCCVVL